MLNHNVIWRSTFHRCFQFARPLVRMGHEVTLVTNSAAERFRFRESILQGVRIVESPDLFWGRLRTGWDPLNALRRSVRLFREPYDVIHEFDSRPTVILPSTQNTQTLAISSPTLVNGTYSQSPSMIRNCFNNFTTK